MLTEKFPAEIKAIFAKYPPENKRSAVMPLLYLAQRDRGCVTRDVLDEIASLCEISATEVASLVGFYTLFRDQDGAPYRVQVCTDLPCALRGAEDFLANVCANLGIQLGETTPDGKVSVEAVTCLAGCDKAPLFQVQSRLGVEYYENQTVQSAFQVINSLRKEDSTQSTRR